MVLKDSLNHGFITLGSVQQFYPSWRWVKTMILIDSSNHGFITLGSVMICLPCYFQCEPTVTFESPRAPLRPVRYMYQ